jgi:hypothetical protein
LREVSKWRAGASSPILQVSSPKEGILSEPSLHAPEWTAVHGPESAGNPDDLIPKYLAASTLERGGRTYYFVDEDTRREFEKEPAAK